MTTEHRRKYKKEYYKSEDQQRKRREYQKKYYSTPEWKEKNKVRMLAWHRKRKYGVTPEQTQQMLEDQKGLCAICKEALITPYLDHNHTTDEVRGFLCRKCNLGLGFFQDNPTLLQCAIMYLEDRTC